MSKVLLTYLFVMLAGVLSLSAQEMVCHDVKATPGATEKFAALGKEKDFQMAHDAPKVLENYVAKGEMKEFKTPDGKTSKAYMVKSEKETNHYLFLVHEWWGLNDNIKRETEEWASKLGNVNVLALDLYDGKATADPAEAGKLMQSVNGERAKSIVSGAFILVGKDAKVATMGWCFGGGWSIQSALIGAKNVIGTVAFYGFPEMDVEKLKTLNADVLAVYGNKDKWITQEVGAKFEAAMKTAGKEIESLYYDADHAFANPSNPNFDEKSATDANKKAFEYLSKRLK